MSGADLCIRRTKEACRGRNVDGYEDDISNDVGDSECDRR